MPTLNLNLGEGLCIDNENKLSVKYTGNYIRITPNGLFVDPLTGAAGSITDNWSTKISYGSPVINLAEHAVIGTGGAGSQGSSPSMPISNFVDVDREVTNIIYSYGVYTVGNRNSSGIGYTSQVRTVTQLVSEMNFPVLLYGGNGAFFIPSTGELIQLTENPNTADVKTGNGDETTTAENGRRGGNVNMLTKVLFMITDIVKNSDIEPGGSNSVIAKLKLLCLYSSVPEYVVGNEYSHGY